MSAGGLRVDDAHSFSRHRFLRIFGESFRVDDETAHGKRDGRSEVRRKREQLVGVAVGHQEELVIELGGRQEEARREIAGDYERCVGNVDHDSG